MKHLSQGITCINRTFKEQAVIVHRATVDELVSLKYFKCLCDETAQGGADDCIDIRIFITNRQFILTKRINLNVHSEAPIIDDVHIQPNETISVSCSQANRIIVYGTVMLSQL